MFTDIVEDLVVQAQVLSELAARSAREAPAAAIACNWEAMHRGNGVLRVIMRLYPALTAACGCSLSSSYWPVSAVASVGTQP